MQLLINVVTKQGSGFIEERKKDRPEKGMGSLCTSGRGDEKPLTFLKHGSDLIRFLPEGRLITS